MKRERLGFNMYNKQKVGKRNIKYLKLGNGEPLLFLSGYCISPHIVQDFIESVNHNYEVISPDIASMGKKLEKIVDYADLTHEFCDKLGMDYYNMIGYSLGGAIAFKMADKDPFKPKKIVGINPVVPTDYKFFSYITRSIKLSLTELKKDGLKNLGWKSDISRNFIDNFRKEVIPNLRLVNDMGRFKADFYVNQPTLIMLGTKDEYFSKDYLNSDFLKCFNNLDVKLIDGCNHTITGDYLETIAKHTKEHFEK